MLINNWILSFWTIRLLWMDNIDDWEFVLDRIGRGGGTEVVICIKAAINGVAIELQVIYGEGRGCVVFWLSIREYNYMIYVYVGWYYCRIILKKKKSF